MGEFLSVVKSLWVVWMLLLFAGIVIWVFLPRNSRRFRTAANIPFEEGRDPGPENEADRPTRHTGAEQG